MSGEIERKGPWSSETLHEFLDTTTIPLRLAGLGSSGYPVMASLWYLRIEDTLWCATQEGASVASILERDGRCSFEVSVEKLPYFGVRGRADATLHSDRGEEILCALIDRYIGTRSSDFAQKLLSRVATETAIAITPRTLFTWDYRNRMDPKSEVSRS